MNNVLFFRGEQYVALGIIAAVIGGFYFSIPAESPAPPPVVTVRYACSEVIRTEDIRFVQLNPAAWETISAETLAAKAPLPLQKPKVETVEEKPEPKIKSVCRKGEKIWYYSKKLKRKMYRLRRSC